MNYKKKNALQLFNVMASLRQSITNQGEEVDRRLLYGLDKNDRKIKKIIDELKEKDLQPDWIKYDNEFKTKKKELLNQYAKKDEDGNFVQIEGDVVDIKDDLMDEFKDKIKSLQDEFIPILNDLDKTWSDLLEEDCEIELYNIKEEWLPIKIKPSDYGILKELIIEDEITE